MTVSELQDHPNYPGFQERAPRPSLEPHWTSPVLPLLFPLHLYSLAVVILFLWDVI